jgi:hypothetical protein
VENENLMILAKESEVKTESGPVKIDRISLKMNGIKPAPAFKPNGPDKSADGSPESEGGIDQSLKRKGDEDSSSKPEKKGKFEGTVSKADRIKRIQTPSKTSANDPAPQSQSNKRPGAPKRRGILSTHPQIVKIGI